MSKPQQGNSFLSTHVGWSMLLLVKIILLTVQSPCWGVTFWLTPSPDYNIYLARAIKISIWLQIPWATHWTKTSRWRNWRIWDLFVRASWANRLHVKTNAKPDFGPHGKHRYEAQSIQSFCTNQYNPQFQTSLRRFRLPIKRPPGATMI